MTIMINYMRTLVGICLLSVALISCTANIRPEGDVAAGEESVQPAAEVPEPSSEEVNVTLTLPVFSSYASKTPVALVNDEPIMLKELKDVMTSLHKGMEQETFDQKKMMGSLDEYYISLLDRLIVSRLVVEEALNIGLDEQPEIQDAVKKFSDKTLRRLLFKEYLKDKDLEAEIPEDEVTRLYRDMIREYNLSSLLFKTKEDAERVSKELSSGADFDSLAAKLVEEGAAKGTEKGDNYVKATDLLPHVLKIARKMDVGSISPVVEGAGKGFLIFKIENVRYPDNPDAREKARQLVLNAVRNDTIQRFVDSLVEKNATLDKKLFNSVDFDIMKKDYKALNDDKRAVATIEGEESFTVSDVANFFNDKYFHGVEKLTKSLNALKLKALTGLVQKKVLADEAHRRCLDKSDEYNEKVKKYENSLLFGSFINKVIAPDVKITQDEVETYYAEHQEEFMTPEMMHIDSSLVFTTRQFAEDAARKLREGTDLNWMLENAEGQVDKDRDTLLNLGGRFLTVSGLPPEVRKSIAGAKKGDIRVYESPEGDFYVLSIIEELPAQPQPFDDVKMMIANRIHGEKIGAAVDDYIEKLKEVYDVKIFIDLDK